MSYYTETLAKLAQSAKRATSAENVVAERATAHAPHALLAMYYFEGESKRTIDEWINDACDAANVKSNKGKRNAAALRQNGYNGLFRMAQELKWIDDNIADYPAILPLVMQFCRIDWNGDVARNLVIGKRLMIPAEAKIASIEELQAAINSAEIPQSERDEDAKAYYTAINAPTTFSALLKAAKSVAKKESDTFGNKVASLVEAIGKLEIADLRKREAELSALLTALNAAQGKLEMADEIDATEKQAANG